MKILFGLLAIWSAVSAVLFCFSFEPFCWESISKAYGVGAIVLTIVAMLVFDIYLLIEATL